MSESYDPEVAFGSVDGNGKYSDWNGTYRVIISIYPSAEDLSITPPSTNQLKNVAYTDAVREVFDAFGVSDLIELCEEINGSIEAYIIFNPHGIEESDIRHHGSMELPDDWDELDIVALTGHPNHLVEREDLTETEFFRDGEVVGEGEIGEALCSNTAGTGETYELDSDELTSRRVCGTCKRAMWSRSNDERGWDI